MSTDRMHTQLQQLNHELEKLIERQQAVEQELRIQFQRIADLQAEMDLMRAEWAKIARRK